MPIWDPKKFKQVISCLPCESSLRVCFAQFVFFWMDPYVARSMPSTDVALALGGYKSTDHSRRMPTQLEEELMTICLKTLFKLLRTHSGLHFRKHNHLPAQHTKVIMSCGQCWISGKAFLENCFDPTEWAIPPVRLGLSGRNSGKTPERPRKRSQSVSWNFPREYGWDAPNPIIQGI